MQRGDFGHSEAVIAVGVANRIRFGLLERARTINVRIHEEASRGRVGRRRRSIHDAIAVDVRNDRSAHLNLGRRKFAEVQQKVHVVVGIESDLKRFARVANAVHVKVVEILNAVSVIVDRHLTPGRTRKIVRRIDHHLPGRLIPWVEAGILHCLAQLGIGDFDGIRPRRQVEVEISVGPGDELVDNRPARIARTVTLAAKGS